MVISATKITIKIMWLLFLVASIFLMARFAIGDSWVSVVFSFLMLIPILTCVLSIFNSGKQSGVERWSE